MAFRGIVKTQPVTAYADIVEHMDRKSRRKALQKEYEKNRVSKGKRKKRTYVQVDDSENQDVQHQPQEALCDNKDACEQCGIMANKIQLLERKLRWFEECRDWVSANGKDSGLIEYLVKMGQVPDYCRWDGEPMNPLEDFE